MRRRDFFAVLAVAAARPSVAESQQPAVVPHIGVLMGANPGVEAARLNAFRIALENLGYHDGQSVALEVRYAEGQPDRFGILARELAALQPNVIVCVGRQEIAALQAVTRTIPIVFMQAPDPVELGFVSLAHPGGNITGFTQMSGELDSKRLELLHEIAPSVSRAGFLINPNFLPRVEERFVAAATAANGLGINLQRLAATAPTQLTSAFAMIQTSSIEALLVQNDPMLSGTELPRIVEFAAANRLATIFEAKDSAVAGGLLSYGYDGIENARRAAGYVAQILKGAKPAELPVQQPTKFELVINLKTAKALGLDIPQSILLQATDVIE